MSGVTLRLEGRNDIIDLNGVATDGYGFQAISGANIFGLPPVVNQWWEGAGDGSIFRGKRVRSRDGDLPIYILGDSRAHLKQLLSRLTRVLAFPCDLVVQDEDGSQWATTVVRSGGGGFVYGEDTIGDRDMSMVLTFTSGDPYFTSREVSVQQVGGVATASAFLSSIVSLPVSPTSTIGTMTIENTGDAEAFPTWVVYGPGNNFKAVSPSGQTLWWKGSLLSGEWLTLDTKEGTVIDHLGVNRYAELAAAPRFWSVPPGVTGSQVSLQGTIDTSKIVCFWRARKWMVV